MLDLSTPYKPKNLPEGNVLCAELIQKGHKAASKFLAKEKKDMYPETGTPTECSMWWLQGKEGKKKNKRAMCIMVSHYERVVKQLDRSQGEVLELEAKTKSQEEELKVLKLKLQQCDNQGEEIKLLKLKLMQMEEENAQLNHEMLKNSTKVSQLMSKTDSQKKEITSLKQTVLEQETENKQLKEEIADYNTSGDTSKKSLSLLVPVTYSRSWQRSLASLLEELPALQCNNYNYEFWAKIKSWLLKGEVDPQYVFQLVRIKCPPEAWQAIEEKFSSKDLTEMASSNLSTSGKLEKLWKCVSEALGPGTKLFQLYYHRRQKVGETFEEYILEKFRLYCSYGVDKMEPDKNDQHFLCNVLEKAANNYQILELQYPTSYNDLLIKAMLIENMPRSIEWNNKCFNCGKKGHTKAECRRPGGGAEVGRNQCFTCGGYNHKAKNCWTY
ncbi:uncharacterized protein LOC132876100 [Neoarius graeffei]|uniref:uncharacterized protein LOC132876100 n=1 Tax=Neoarius graeffei TaxID=443677 RepID=UPI00298CC0C3|nr:uncharacterized protein LOC132876100 [Neoarius graeffei]